MKRLLIVLLSACILAGCSDYTIELTGTPGISYRGTISYGNGGGHDVFGVTPHNYDLPEDTKAMGEFHKLGQDGKLKAEMKESWGLLGSHTISRDETSDSYGIVAVSN